MRETDPVTIRGLRPRLRTAEATAIEKLRRISLPLLRLTIGIVFVWFGALKIGDATPIGDFVARTLPWFDRDFIVPTLGWFEVAMGLAIIAGRLLTLVCAGLVAHLTGTFLSLVMQPEVTFQGGNPLMLTTEGEFVVKNIVFIAAALVIAARFHLEEREQEASPQPVAEPAIAHAAGEVLAAASEVLNGGEVQPATAAVPSQATP
ncbi:MAG: hypothetical protein ACJ72N_08670 [Labedaea sp.]